MGAPRKADWREERRKRSWYLKRQVAVCTWAPRGQTPTLPVKLTRDHLSALSGITLDGRLFMRVRQAGLTMPQQ